MTMTKHTPHPVTEYLGSITVVIRARSPQAASADLKAAARLIEDSMPGVGFADHNGDVELASAIDRECLAEPSPGNPPITFDDYEVHGISAVEPNYEDFEQVDDADAQFWSLFGHIPGVGVECIGDFASRELAETIYARITGRPYSTINTGE